MRGRQLIDGAAFGPDALKAIGEAFNAAWVEIAGNFGNVPADIDNARYRLANALLSVASEDSRDAEELKRAALERIVLDYGRYSPRRARAGAASRPSVGVELPSGPIGRDEEALRERCSDHQFPVGGTEPRLEREVYEREEAH